jgi:hypothetical protein
MRLIVGIGLLTATFVATVAHAEPRGRVTELPETIIHGRPHVPSAVYVLGRATPEPETSMERSSFVRRIAEATSRPPF